MRERGKGSIICTASVAGLRSGAGPSPYSASKAGVINLVQTACQELTGSGVRVNAICPGLIETSMTQPLFGARAAGKGHKLGQLNPRQHGGHRRDRPRGPIFLASDDASYVNGQAIIVNGNLKVRTPCRPAAQVRGESSKPPQPLIPANAGTQMTKRRMVEGREKQSARRARRLQ